MGVNVSLEPAQPIEQFLVLRKDDPFRQPAKMLRVGADESNRLKADDFRKSIHDRRQGDVPIGNVDGNGSARRQVLDVDLEGLFGQQVHREWNRC